MRKIAILLISTLLFSYTLPFASAVTETQYSDGSTTFTHVFSQSGDALTPGVTLPYGANVEDVEFVIEGEASQQNWINLSVDRDFNGPGSTNTNFNPTWFNGGYRTNLASENDELQLKNQETTSYWSLTSSNDVSSSSGGVLNTTGGQFSMSENGLKGITTERTETLTGGNWNYVGPVIKQYDEIHVTKWTSTSLYNTPSMYRYNATTGTYIGSTNLNIGSCTSSASAYVYDVTSDGNGTVWMVSYSYRYISKWAYNQGDGTSSNPPSYTCQQSWAVPTSGSTRYPYGIAFDPADNEMYLLTGTYQSPSYIVDLWKVNRSSPTTSQASWTLGTIQSGYGIPAGLDVQMPRITYNVFCSSSSTISTNCKARSYLSVYHTTGTWPEHQGDILYDMPIYGLERIDGELAFTCYYTSVCPSGQTRKVNIVGTSTPSWTGTPSSSAAVITSSVKTLSRPVTQVKLGAAVTWEPTGTSVDFMVTNDGGSTWKRATTGNTVTFTNGGSQIAWKAWLNGTSSDAPILDTVGLSYTATYSPTGQVRMYYYAFQTGNTMPVASTIWWNASTPGGSSLDFYWYTGSSACNGKTHNIASSGSTVTFSGTTSYLTLCIDFDAGTNNEYTPTLYDFNVVTYTNAPQNVKLDIGNDNSFEWSHTGNLLSRITVSNNDMIDSFNDLVPQTGTGTIVIPIELHSGSAGKVNILSMNIEYTMVTVNLDLQYDENMVLHERSEPYEIITRHVIGDNSLSITNAELTFLASPSSESPKLSWTNDGTLVDDDPEDWIIPDQSSTWTSTTNGIFEIHWMFRVTDDFPEQNNVGFRVSCTDDNGFTPETLATVATGIYVNQSYGLGWLNLHDVEGEVTENDVQDGHWIVAGETVHFQGQIWFAGTQDAPLNSVFDVRVVRKDSQGDFTAASWKDTSNANGSFFISVEIPSMDIPDGVTFEIQIYNERDPTKVLATENSWRRTIRVDSSPPAISANWPAEGDYEASSEAQQIAITIDDAVGQPTNLTLHYWVEADHDTNRNGVADQEEYVNQTLTNVTEDAEKVFFGIIDDSRNPNMARVSYYVSGTDVAGNPLVSPDGPGFGYDLATYRTRKDMASVFTGLNWVGHSDGNDVFSGTEQSISVGLVDANGIIDFEYIALIFDFEGPDPERDQQRMWYDGREDSWFYDESYLELLSSSSTTVTTNNSGLPWIFIDFDFKFSWDWPDEDVSDLALEYKELGSPTPTRIEFSEHTFSVENDLVLNANSYTVEDVAEPRVGTLDDATPVRPDDRLRWSGHVVYEDSNVPAPNDLGITVEVFDGVQYWSDGSLADDGSFSIEVPLSAATSLQSAESRTFLTGVRNVPGRGEDMTRDTVATTLQLQVDHTPPRVHHRMEPIDVIDISTDSDLTSVPVRFVGWEECLLADEDDRCAAFGQSPQWVNWVMRDEVRTIAAGQSPLAMQVLDGSIEWIGEVDLTSDGVVTPRSGYRVGFWITGHDAAGNEFPMTANTESDPVRERVEDDNDLDLAWVRLGATVPELIVQSVTLEEDIVSEGSEIKVVAIIANVGGVNASSFTVKFFAGDKEITTERIAGLPEDTEHRIQTTWKAKKGVDRITVVVDADNEVVEVDEEGNSMSVSVSVEYSWGMGWIDSWRKNPLTVIGVVFAFILLPVIAVITWKTSLSGAQDLYAEELHYEDEDDDEWEYEDEDDDGWE
ncbi:MAG: CARDB domain-containing protein [Candidatus Thermoplasmatota archaeon]|nr:CARDB domain-containing protein [Candidatus Thermoplasmatota archaeon]